MKIGIDLVHVKRIEGLISDKVSLEKIFHTEELTDIPESLAGKLAIKEAYFKAIGKKIDWLDLKIINKETGQPVLFLNKKEQTNISISISHDGDYVVGVVLINL